jgi:hypothetical protein
MLKIPTSKVDTAIDHFVSRSTGTVTFFSGVLVTRWEVIWKLMAPRRHVKFDIAALIFKPFGHSLDYIFFNNRIWFSYGDVNWLITQTFSGVSIYLILILKPIAKTSGSTRTDTSSDSGTLQLLTEHGDQVA